MTGTNRVLGKKPQYSCNLRLGGYSRESINNNYYRNYVKYSISCSGITTLELPLVLKKEIDYHIYLLHSSVYTLLRDISSKNSYSIGSLNTYEDKLVIDLTEYFSFNDIYSKSGIKFDIVFQYGDSISEYTILEDMMTNILPVTPKTLGYPDIPIAKDRMGNIIKGSEIVVYPSVITSDSEKNWLESQVYGEFTVTQGSSATSTRIDLYVYTDQKVPNSDSGSLGIYYNILDKNLKLIESGDLYIEVNSFSTEYSLHVSNTEFDLTNITFSIISLTNNTKVLDKSTPGSHVLYKK